MDTITAKYEAMINVVPFEFHLWLLKKKSFKRQNWYWSLLSANFYNYLLRSFILLCCFGVEKWTMGLHMLNKVFIPELYPQCLVLWDIVFQCNPGEPCSHSIMLGRLQYSTFEVLSWQTFNIIFQIPTRKVGFHYNTL